MHTLRSVTRRIGSGPSASCSLSIVKNHVADQAWYRKSYLHQILPFAGYRVQP